MNKPKQDQIEAGTGRAFVGEHGVVSPDRLTETGKSYMSKNILRGVGLDSMQQKALQYLGTPCWIYNVSPVFTWEPSYAGFGSFRISPRTEDQRVSIGHPIPKNIINGYDAGDGVKKFYPESGEDVAESLVGNSKNYPAILSEANNNLENWGVFITYGKPLEELTEEEQEALLIKAEDAHEKKCREVIAKADFFYQKKENYLILDVHRGAAKFLNEPRDWVNLQTMNQKQANFKECPNCGHENKVKVVQCHNCPFIFDKDRYAELFAGQPVTAKNTDKPTPEVKK